MLTKKVPGQRECSVPRAGQPGPLGKKSGNASCRGHHAEGARGGRFRSESIKVHLKMLQDCSQGLLGSIYPGEAQRSVAP